MLMQQNLLFIKPGLLRFLRVMVLSCLFVNSGVSAQSPTYQLSIYNSENGFSSNVVKSIFKDKTGFIWLLSESGLTRFDGYTFKNLNTIYQTHRVFHRLI
jgi:ligand-binding sensor domain-containing protein